MKSVDIKKRFIYKTIQRLRETGSIADRSTSGGPRTARTKNRINLVREKIRPNPCRSARKLAKEENMDERSMWRLLKDDLCLRAYKKRQQHGLSKQQQQARVKKSKSEMVQ